MVPGIFLDRDGVIIANRTNYVRSWADVEFLPGALEALKSLRSLFAKIVIVTNQSAVGRGLMSLSQAVEINQRMVANIEEAGGRIDGVYICPHAPNDNCSCRKPEPGMLWQAARDLEIVLHDSLIIGDALTDIAAGKRVGLRQCLLVRTGLGADQARLSTAATLQPFRIYDSLLDAQIHISDWWEQPQEGG